MSNNTLEWTLIKSISDYIDQETTSVYEMHQIAHYLNMQPDITPQIRQKFYDLLSDEDHTKIRKTLCLIEYLTIYSPPKTIQLVNDEKLIEHISSTIHEIYLQDQTLNLLKLWDDEYNDSREQMDKVFELIGNLECFGISLPAFYHSQYKSAAAGPTNDKVEEAIEDTEAAQLPAKVKEIIQKSKDLIENIKKVLEQDPSSQSKAFRVNKLQVLCSQNVSICSDLADQKMSESKSEVKQRIEEEIKELKSYRSKLKEEMEALDKKDATQNQNSADSYKIVVLDTDSNQQTEENWVMEVEELLCYKIYPCNLGVSCNFAPIQSLQILGHSSYSREMHCASWHVPNDKKRPVYDEEDQRFYYSYMFCADKDGCMLGDSCLYSHNFFESYYHPQNYKKKKCNFGKSCRNKKYCPYFHTEAEKSYWKEIAKQYFETDFEPHEQQQNIQEIPTWKNQDPDDYSNKVEEPEDYGYQKNKESNQPWNNHDEDNSENIYKLGSVGSHFAQFNSQFNKKKYQQYQQEQELKGTFKSKLIVRKKYDDPGLLTSFFHKSSTFNGIPFFTYYPAEAQKNENQKEEDYQSEEEEEEEEGNSTEEVNN